MRCRGLIALLVWGQSVAAADLGTWGDLWPVKEPDMLTVIMQRLTVLEQSGEMGRKMDAFKERVIRNSLRPPAVPGIGRTEKYGSRLFDPSVRLAADIRDNEGRVFSRQGEVMNPLQYVPFNQTLYFINGDDPAQVAWMKRLTGLRSGVSELQLPCFTAVRAEIALMSGGAFAVTHHPVSS